VIHPRSTPTGYAASPKPIAATLEKEGVGARSGTRPFCGLASCQKKSNVRVCTVSRNGSFRETIGGTTPVVGGAHASANATASAIGDSLTYRCMRFSMRRFE
jgi:hypothetical protein